MKSIEFRLLTLPCGCVVDIDTTCVYEDEYLFCPWCMAVWIFDEAYPWLAENSDAHLGHLARGGFALFRFGENIYEYVKRCDKCDCPIVREMKTREQIHLDVPPHTIKRLQN